MKPNRESQKREQMWRPVFSGSILVRSSSGWWTVLISRWQRHLRPASLWSSRWSVHDRANHTVLYHFKTWETGDRITLEEGFRRQVSTDGFWSPQLKVVVTQPRRQLYLDWRQALRSFSIVSSHFDHRLFAIFVIDSSIYVTWSFFRRLFVAVNSYSPGAWYLCDCMRDKSLLVDSIPNYFYFYFVLRNTDSNSCLRLPNFSHSDSIFATIQIRPTNMYFFVLPLDIFIILTPSSSPRSVSKPWPIPDINSSLKKWATHSTCWDPEKQVLKLWRTSFKPCQVKCSGL